MLLKSWRRRSQEGSILPWGLDQAVKFEVLFAIESFHDFKERPNVELHALMTAKELIVAAFLTKELLKVEERLLDLLQDFRLLKSVLLVLQRDHVEVKAGLTDHLHELCLVARVCGRVA